MWNRKLWGVEFSDKSSDEPVLLGSLWRTEKSIPYPDEPTRKMLFVTRKAARKWCKDQMQKYSNRTDCCKDWKFRPVRVREQVCKIK